METMRIRDLRYRRITEPTEGKLRHRVGQAGASPMISSRRDALVNGLGTSRRHSLDGSPN